MPPLLRKFFRIQLSSFSQLLQQIRLREQSILPPVHQLSVTGTPIPRIAWRLHCTVSSLCKTNKMTVVALAIECHAVSQHVT